jgi:hypothetical protein
MQSKTAEIASKVLELNSRATVDTGRTGGGGFFNKGIMEHKVVTSLVTLTNDATEFSIWTIKLKNALDQVNMEYGPILELIEKNPDIIVTYESWAARYGTALVQISGLSAEAVGKLSGDLYVLMVDKCTSNQVLMFNNDDKDGFYAYNQLYRSFTQTAGLGGI